MRMRISMALSLVLLLSIGVATEAASGKAAGKHAYAASRLLCETNSGTFSTKDSTSFFAPFYKKQGVLWTCNGYGGGSAVSQALVQSCTTDGGKAASTLDSGVATCWKNPAV
jgi:hypothetical protein